MGNGKQYSSGGFDVENAVKGPQEVRIAGVATDRGHLARTERVSAKTLIHERVFAGLAHCGRDARDPISTVISRTTGGGSLIH